MAASSLKGSLFLRAGVRAERTVLLQSRGTYPLQVLRPQVEPVQGGLSLVILLLSGGLLDGDSVSLEVVVEPGARLALRTQAATQVHCGHSTQRVHVTVAEDGWFSYLPHAAVPHAGADYHAQTRISLADSARAFIADALTPGRVQFGEYFAYRQVRLDLDIQRDGAVVARERALIRPLAELHHAMWGKSSHVASAYAVGQCEAPAPAPRPNAPAHLATGDTADLIAGDRKRVAVTQVGATELANGGWFVRALADRATDLDDLLLGLAAQWWGFRADLGTLPMPAHGSLVPADVSALD